MSVLLLGLVLGLTPRMARAQEGSAGVAAPASPKADIPLEGWDDDWEYPEGRLKLAGRRYSLFAGLDLTGFANGRSRNLFGSVINPELNLFRPEPRGTQLDYDLHWIGHAKSDEVRIVAPTLGLRGVFAEPAGRPLLVPFGALRVGPYFVKGSALGSHTVLGANASVGVEVARRVAVQARYDLVRKAEGVNLSTWSVSALFRVPLGTPPGASAKMKAAIPPPGDLVDVGGYRLHLVCRGEGTPTVVLEAGMSDSWIAWVKVQPALAKTTRVCSYDRAGIGYSDPGPQPRTSDRMAAELHTLLHKAGVEGPYVLVGHSFGGHDVRLFASRYRDEVAGMVLVEAWHEDEWARYPPEVRERMARRGARLQQLAEAAERGEAKVPMVSNLPPALASRPAWYRTGLQEYRSLDESAAQVRASDRALTVPLVLISAGRHRAPGLSREAKVQVESVRQETQAELGTLSPNTARIVAQKSGPAVPRDHPEVVVAAVRELVEALRWAATHPEAVSRLRRTDPSRLPHPVPLETRRQTFAIVWRTIRDEFWDPQLRGVDWEAARLRYGPKAEAAETDLELYGVLNEMLDELHVSHLAVGVRFHSALFAQGGIGIDVRIIDGQAVITRVEGGSVAERSGLRPGFVIREVDGASVEQLAGRLWKHTRRPPEERAAVASAVLAATLGTPGIAVRLTCLDQQDRPQSLTLTRERRGGELAWIAAQLPAVHGEQESKRLAGGIGYIRFDSFLPSVAAKFRSALGSLRDAPALIIDLRGNSGGVDDTGREIAASLLAEKSPWSESRTRKGMDRRAVHPKRDAYRGPVVLLIDETSGSEAEQFAASLQEIGRASIVGQASPGGCLAGDLKELPTGGVFLYPTGDCRTPKGVEIEGRGVIPDQEMRLTRAALQAGSDPQLEQSIRFIQQRLSPGGEPEHELQKRIQTRLEQTLEKAGYPGVTAAVVLPDGQVFTAAAGWADAKRTVPLKPTDRMPAGSVGKTFVAAAILKAVDEGRLDLDSKVERWLGGEPWFARVPNAHDLTLRLLLSHRSGMADPDEHAFLKAITTDLDKTWTPRELLGFVLDKKPRSRAATKFFYTDMNYLAAGLVYEKATGGRLFDDIDQKILGPLGLDQTVTSQSRQMQDVVPGQMHDPLKGESIRDGRFVYNAQMEYAGGGLISTTRDLARWAKLLWEGRVFSPPQLEQMLAGKPAEENAAYGLGVAIIPSAAGPTYLHDGWIFGYQTVILYLPDYKVAAALQINSDPRRSFKVSPGNCLGQIVGIVIRDLKARPGAAGPPAPSPARG